MLTLGKVMIVTENVMLSTAHLRRQGLMTTSVFLADQPVETLIF